MPAGKYDILRDDPQTNVLIFRNFAAKKSVVVLFETRLARRQDQNTELVFDKDASGNYLSEIHIPGDDGYFIKGAVGGHTHDRVQASKTAKKG